MADETNISWADATLNFWIGCTKVSPACDHCYAEAWGNRFGVKWGPGELRRKTVRWLSKVRKLQRLALAKRAAGGGAFFCFSNSLSDIFDKEVPIAWLAEAIEAMRLAPDVTFLLLTKRPGIIVKRAREAAKLSLGAYDDEEGVRSWWPRNAAILCTVVSQPEADSEIPKLLAAKAVLHPAFVGVSMEPLLGDVRLGHTSDDGESGWDWLKGERWYITADDLGPHRGGVPAPKLDWVITGGESGTHARPSDPAWFRSLRDQCAAAGVAFHFKQWGEWVGSDQGVSPGVYTDAYPGGVQQSRCLRVGKDHDPGTLDGVLHDARPVLKHLEAA